MKDKVIVITGASRGLGAALAVLFASKQAKVVVSARNEKDLQDVAGKTGAFPIVADVTCEADMVNLADQTIKKFGRIDIWINNAGIWIPRAPFEEADMKKAHTMFEVNVFGTVYGAKAALAHMRKNQAAMIVNVVSTSALNGRPNSALYSSSKYAARGFTDSLREELKGSGITVVGIYPGGIKTLLFEDQKPAEYNDFMSPESVAEKIVANLEKPAPDPEQVIRRPGQG